MRRLLLISAALTIAAYAIAAAAAAGPAVVPSRARPVTVTFTGALARVWNTGGNHPSICREYVTNAASLILCRPVRHA